MKICVCGATGGCGQRLVEQALDTGHQVVALVRSPEKIVIKHDNLKVEKVDVCKVDDLVPHFTGSDVVMSCLGHPVTFISKQYFYSESCRAIVEAMRKTEVKRFVAVTAWCTVYRPEHPKLIEWFLKPMFIGRNLDDMDRMESYLQAEAADIDWTCVKPPGLTDEPVTDKPVEALEGQFIPDRRGRMARADVARFMLSILNNEDWYKKLVSVVTV